MKYATNEQSNTETWFTYFNFKIIVFKVLTASHPFYWLAHKIYKQTKWADGYLKLQQQWPGFSFNGHFLLRCDYLQIPFLIKNVLVIIIAGHMVGSYYLFSHFSFIRLALAVLAFLVLQGDLRMGSFSRFHMLLIHPLKDREVVSVKTFENIQIYSDYDSRGRLYTARLFVLLHTFDYARLKQQPSI